MGNNAELGISVQKAICQRYMLQLHPNAVEQFNSNYNPNYAALSEKIIANIFNDIGSYPVECTTYAPSEKYGETLSPHNFVLKNGKTLSIRTNMKGDKIAPRVVGQCGISVFNAHFSEISRTEVNDKNEIKEIVFNYIHKMLPIFIDYMFISDYTVWIYDNNKKGCNPEFFYAVFDNRLFVDIQLVRNNFTFTRDLEQWNESTTLKYKGRSLAEIQIHKNRTFKFRFIMSSLSELLCEVKKTTETLGMTAEKSICDLFNLKYPENFKKRTDMTIEREIMPAVKDAFNQLPPAIQHTGSMKGERGKESKCSYDFLLEGNKTLSLKTNTGIKVCPPEVGQPGADTCYYYFGHLTEHNYIDSDIFKNMVLNHIAEMMKIYICHLFDSDFLLWIYKRSGSFKYKIYSSECSKKFVWEPSLFTFTKKTIDAWNESNTVMYNGISVGEFQVHTKRSCFKFRFNMENLNKLLERGE